MTKDLKIEKAAQSFSVLRATDTDALLLYFLVKDEKSRYPGFYFFSLCLFHDFHLKITKMWEMLLPCRCLRLWFSLNCGWYWMKKLWCVVCFSWLPAFQIAIIRVLNTFWLVVDIRAYVHTYILICIYIFYANIFLSHDV